MQTSRHRALSVLFAAALSACGGGGGDSGAVPSDSAGLGSDPAASASGGSPSAQAPAPPSGGAAPVPAPAPGAQAFSAFDPVVVASSANPFHAPAVARLAGGGNVVLWAEGGQLMGRRTDAGGAAMGDPFAIGSTSQASGGFSVAPAPDGGFIVVWVVETLQPMTQFHAVSAIQARRYSPAGDLVWESRVNEGLFHAIGQPVARPTADGGFVVGWTAKVFLTAPEEGYLQRLAADGSRSGPQSGLGIGGGTVQEHLSLAVLPDGSTFVAWRQRLPGGNSFTFQSRRFGADLAPLTEAAAFPGFASSTPFPVEVAALDDGNVAAAWGASGASTRPEVRVAVLSPQGRAVSAVQASEVLEFAPSDVDVVSFGPSGFGVAWQLVRGGSRETSATISLWRFDGAGLPLGSPQDIDRRLVQWVSPTTGFAVQAGAGFDLHGGADGHWILAFHRADERANTYLTGR